MLRSIIVNLISDVIFQVICYVIKDFNEWKNRRH